MGSREEGGAIRLANFKTSEWHWAKMTRLQLDVPLSAQIPVSIWRDGVQGKLVDRSDTWLDTHLGNIKESSDWPGWLFGLSHAFVLFCFLSFSKCTCTISNLKCRSVETKHQLSHSQQQCWKCDTEAHWSYLLLQHFVCHPHCDLLSIYLLSCSQTHTHTLSVSSEAPPPYGRWTFPSIWCRLEHINWPGNIFLVPLLSFIYPVLKLILPSGGKNVPLQQLMTPSI